MRVGFVLSWALAGIVASVWASDAVLLVWLFGAFLLVSVGVVKDALGR